MPRDGPGLGTSRFVGAAAGQALGNQNVVMVRPGKVIIAIAVVAVDVTSGVAVAGAVIASARRAGHLLGVDVGCQLAEGLAKSIAQRPRATRSGGC